MRVFGTMKGRAMRLWQLEREGHKGLWHNQWKGHYMYGLWYNEGEGHDNLWHK